MADAKVNATTVIFDNNDYKFKTTGQTILFDGYLKIYQSKQDDSDERRQVFEDKYKEFEFILNHLGEPYLKKTYEFTHGKIVKFHFMEIIQVPHTQVKEIIKQ